jgi:hypothetical protein
MYKLTRTFINPKVSNRILDFLYPKEMLGQPQRKDLISGVEIANDFLLELERCGLNQIFEEPLEPSFMLEGEERGRFRSRGRWRRRR